MKLTPRYGDDPVLTLDRPVDAALEPTLRQRRRLATALESFTPEQWAHPSRCDAWSARDVVLHLQSVNSFWAFSVLAGLRGEPTTFLATFDPVSSPVDLVAAAGAEPNEAVLERFVASNDALLDAFAALDDAGWSALAEAPPGHISIGALAHHALWDAWVHERDILLPMGIAPAEEADEITACLRYAAALGPAFAINRGLQRTGVLAVAVHDPDVAFVVDIGDRASVRSQTGDGDLQLAGNAVDVLEALSIRRPFDPPIPAAAAWMVSGLAETFDTDIAGSVAPA